MGNMRQGWHWFISTFKQNIARLRKMRLGIPSGTSKGDLSPFPQILYHCFTSSYQYCQKQKIHFIHHKLYHFGARNNPNPKRELPMSALHLIISLHSLFYYTSQHICNISGIHLVIHLWSCFKPIWLFCGTKRWISDGYPVHSSKMSKKNYSAFQVLWNHTTALCEKLRMKCIPVAQLVFMRDVEIWWMTPSYESDLLNKLDDLVHKTDVA